MSGNDVIARALSAAEEEITMVIRECDASRQMPSNIVNADRRREPFAKMSRLASALSSSSYYMLSEKRMKYDACSRKLGRKYSMHLQHIFAHLSKRKLTTHFLRRRRWRCAVVAPVVAAISISSNKQRLTASRGREAFKL